RSVFHWRLRRSQVRPSRSLPAGCAMSADTRRDSPDGRRCPAPLPRLRRQRCPVRNRSTDRDRRYLRRAIELAHNCPPSRSAFSVGAVIVEANGVMIATGYSRETHPHDHAEEVALAKLMPHDYRLIGATLYSAPEQGSTRSSPPPTCHDTILPTPTPRNVLAV